MARINIEDSIHKDARFDELKSRLGGRFQAMGALVYAWSLAQEYFLKNGGKIPVAAWDRQMLPRDIIAVGLARVEGDFIEMEGTEKQFSWLSRAQSAGKSSGKTRSAKSLGNSGTQVNASERKRTSSSFSFSKEEEIHMSSGDDEPVLIASEGEGEAGERVFGANDLAEMWNELAPVGLPRVMLPLSDKRRRMAKTALKAHPEPEFWADVLTLISQSNFLQGKLPVSGNRSKPWKCHFEFILNINNATKIIEGNYS